MNGAASLNSTDTRRSWRFLGKIKSWMGAISAAIATFLIVYQEAERPDQQPKVARFEAKFAAYTNAAALKNVWPPPHADIENGVVLIHRAPKLESEASELAGAANSFRRRANRSNALTRINALAAEAALKSVPDGTEVPAWMVTALSAKPVSWESETIGSAAFNASAFALLAGGAGFVEAWALVFVAAFAWFFAMQRLTDISRALKGGHS